MSVLHAAQTEANGSPREYFWWLCNETRFRIGIHDGYPSPLCVFLLVFTHGSAALFQIKANVCQR